MRGKRFCRRRVELDVRSGNRKSSDFSNVLWIPMASARPSMPDFLGFRTGPAMFLDHSGSLPRPIPLRICVPNIQNDAHGIIVCACGSALLGSSQNCMHLPGNWHHRRCGSPHRRCGLAHRRCGFCIVDLGFPIDITDFASSIWVSPSTSRFCLVDMDLQIEPI